MKKVFKCEEHALVLKKVTDGFERVFSGQK